MTKETIKNTTNFRLLCQKWEESEAGWGTRPDGYSLHLSEEDRKAYVQTHWDALPKEVPDEYSRPDGTPYWFEASEEEYNAVTTACAKGHGKHKFGIYHWERTYPGNGGTDGWKNG